MQYVIGSHSSIPGAISLSRVVLLARKCHIGKKSFALLLLCNLSMPFIEPSRASAPVGPNEIAASRAHINKGNYLLTHQQFQAALVEYEQALASDPSSSVAKENIVLAHNNWGIFYFHQKKYDEARDEWNAALKLNANDRNAKNNLTILKNATAKQAPPAPAAVAHDDIDSASNTMVGGEKIVPPPAGAQAAKEDNRGVVILSQPSKNSGAKLDSDYGLDGDAISTSSANRAPAATSSSTSLSTSGATLVPASNNGSSGSTSTASSTNTTVNSAPEPGKGNIPAASMPTPMYSPPQVIAQPTNVSTPAINQPQTLEATLGQIELKVYGAKKDLPIVQRLEKLEQDTNAKTGSGSIADRIQSLAKTYGL